MTACEDDLVFSASRGIQTHSPLAKVLALDDDYRNTEIEDNDEKEVDSNEKRTEEELEREEKKHESDVEYKGRRDEHKNSEGCIKADGTAHFNYSFFVAVTN